MVETSSAVVYGPQITTSSVVQCPLVNSAMSNMNFAGSLYSASGKLHERMVLLCKIEITLDDTS